MGTAWMRRVGTLAAQRLTLRVPAVLQEDPTVPDPTVGLCS